MNISSSQALQGNPLIGFILETAVANAVRSTLFGNVTATPPLAYWNYNNQLEVDLVVEGTAGALYPLEIKASSAPPRAYPGLNAFAERYKDKVSVRCVISTNERCYWIDDATLHKPLSGL